jgi:alpha-1,3-mannosyltransferase
MGEPTLFCKDLWHTGYGKIAVVPSVNIGYNDEESKVVKSRHGYVSEWVRKKEKETETEIRSDLVNWQSKPPALIKCMPTYEQPSWVPVDEALE